MRLRCETRTNDRLTLGKTYAVLGERYGWPLIRDDNGDVDQFNPSRFTKVPPKSAKP